MVLAGLGSESKVVVLAGLGSESKVVVLASLGSGSIEVGLSSFAGWWRRTVTIGIVYLGAKVGRKLGFLG